MLPATSATWRCCELNSKERRSTCLLNDLRKHQMTMGVRVSCITPQVSLTACLILLTACSDAWSLQGGCLTPADGMWHDGCCNWQLAMISHSGALQDVNRSCLAVVCTQKFSAVGEMQAHHCLRAAFSAMPDVPNRCRSTPITLSSGTPCGRRCRSLARGSVRTVRLMPVSSCQRARLSNRHSRNHATSVHTETAS